MGHQQLAYGAGYSLNTLICCTLYAFEEVQPEVKSLGSWNQPWGVAMLQSNADKHR